MGFKSKSDVSLKITSNVIDLMWVTTETNMRHVFMFLCFILYLILVLCVPGLYSGGCDGHGKEVVGWGLRLGGG